MNEDDLISDCMQVIEEGATTILQVAVVEWSGPKKPSRVWRTFRRWKRPPTAERLKAARQKALTDRRFYRVCEMCGERQNKGHMHDRSTCQTCA